MPSAMQTAATQTGAPLHSETIRSTNFMPLFSGRLEVRQTLHIGLAVANLGIARLAVEAARRGVEIDRGTLDFAQLVDALRAAVDEGKRAASPREIKFVPPLHIAERVEIVIDEASGDIARHRGAEQGQHEIGSFAHAIPTHCLTEILLVVGHSPYARPIEHAGA